MGHRLVERAVDDQVPERHDVAQGEVPHERQDLLRGRLLDDVGTSRAKSVCGCENRKGNFLAICRLEVCRSISLRLATSAPDLLLSSAGKLVLPKHCGLLRLRPPLRVRPSAFPGVGQRVATAKSIVRSVASAGRVAQYLMGHF